MIFVHSFLLNDRNFMVCIYDNNSLKSNLAIFLKPLHILSKEYKIWKLRKKPVKIGAGLPDRKHKKLSKTKLATETENLKLKWNEIELIENKIKMSKKRNVCFKISNFYHALFCTS